MAKKKTKKRKKLRPKQKRFVGVNKTQPHCLDSIDDLKPARYNPRSIKTRAAAGLEESLKRFGDIGGIVWNSRTGNLVCGHQRVEQLRKQGAVFRDGALESSGERWPVRVVDWTLAQEKTANVAANNPHIAGDFSNGLGDILADIKLSIEDEDFTGLRFDGLELALPDINLGDGAIDEKAGTRRFAVFVATSDKAAKKVLSALVEARGGHLAECSHEDCNVSVRKLDTNAWSERRSQLGKAKVPGRGDQDREPSDSERG